MTHWGLEPDRGQVFGMRRIVSKGTSRPSPLPLARYLSALGPTQHHESHP